MFEVDELSQASPATISRCGMVLLESAELGHSCFITSYCTTLKELIRDNKIGEKVEKLFHYIADLALEFTRKNGKFPCAGNASFLVNHIIRLIECHMDTFKPKFTDQEEIPIPNDIEDRLNNALLYGVIWGIGGALDEFTRPNFDQFIQELLQGEDVRVKYDLDMGEDAETKYAVIKYPSKLGGEYKSVFDMYFDSTEMKWVNWVSTVPPYIVDKDSSYLQLSIPTIDSIRMTAITETLLFCNMHVLLVGPTGTGKSIQVNKLLREKFDSEEWAYF
jgi:dynein heavy chain